MPAPPDRPDHRPPRFDARNLLPASADIHPGDDAGIPTHAFMTSDAWAVLRRLVPDARPHHLRVVGPELAGLPVYTDECPCTPEMLAAYDREREQAARDLEERLERAAEHAQRFPVELGNGMVGFWDTRPAFPEPRIPAWEDDDPASDPDLIVIDDLPPRPAQSRWRRWLGRRLG